MKNKLLFLDAEMGGLNPEKHALLSVGLVVWKDEKIEAKLEVLIKGGPSRVTPEALAVNRINLPMHNRRGLSKARAVQEITDFVNQHFDRKPIIIAGHNVGVDVAFLKKLFASQKVDFSTYFSHRLIDTSSILQYIGIKYQMDNFEIQQFSSSDAAFRNHKIHIEDQKRHTALGDAVATAELFTHLLKDYNLNAL